MYWAILSKKDGYSKKIAMPKFDPIYYEHVYEDVKSFYEGVGLPTGQITTRKRYFKFEKWVDPETAVYMEQ